MQYSRDKPSPNGLLRGNQTKQKDIKKQKNWKKARGNASEWGGETVGLGEVKLVNGRVGAREIYH